MTQVNPEFLWCDFLAGWSAGICGLTIGHPMDTIKVRQQTLGDASGLKIIKNTFRYEGVRGFYKGMLFPALSAGVLNSIFFGAYGNILQTIQTYRGITDNRRTCAEGDTPVHSLWHFDVYVAGALAGLTQVLVGCPIEIVKIQLQSQTGTPKFHWAEHYEAGYKGPFDCAKGVYRESGVRGFYRGFNSMLWRDMPTFGIYVLAYEHFLSVGRPASDHSGDYSVTRQIMAGGASGMVSWQFVIPIDVVKSRLQADNPKAPAYSGFVDCVIKSYRADGISVFGRGFWMISLRAFAVNAGIFVAFEGCLDACKKISKVIPPL